MTTKKVFTKYDTPIEVIRVPFFGELEARSLSDYWREEYLPIEYAELKPVSTEEGLEGVTIVTYE